MTASAAKSKKWLILISFATLVGINQMLWLSFAPIVATTGEHFGVSEFKANLLTLIFPLIYVLFSIHAGKLIDRKGYKKIVSIAALLMLAGSLLRYVAADTYTLVLLGQVLIALTQPYMLNAINKISGDWFDAKTIHSATGVVIGILFVGTLLGAMLPALLLEHFSFKTMLLFNALITLASVLWFVFTIDEKPLHSAQALSVASIFELLKIKRLWIIAILIFISFGYFNGLTNWIALILQPRAISELQAGSITAMFILGGIIGATLVPFLSDAWQKRQIFIVLAIVSAIILSYPLLALANFEQALILGFVLGFVLLGGYPILIAATEQIVAAKDAAQAVAFLQLMGNLGGVAVVLSMEGVKVLSGSWQQTIYVLIALMLLALPFALKLKDQTKI